MKRDARKHKTRLLRASQLKKTRRRRKTKNKMSTSRRKKEKQIMESK